MRLFRRTIQVSVGGLGLVWGLSQVEAGEGGLPLSWLAFQLAPVALAAALAIAVGELRSSGQSAAWSRLGFSPGAARWGLLPFLVAGMALQALQPLRAPESSPTSRSEVVAMLDLPAPVSAHAMRWPGEGELSSAFRARWTVPPAALTLAELVERSRLRAPLGSRPGVDRAEILRRSAWMMAWPLGALLALVMGGRVPEKQRRGGGISVPAAGLGAATATLMILLGSLIASLAIS